MILVLIAMGACTPSYQSRIEAYKLPISGTTDASPDYDNLFYWAAHPAKHDPSDSVPEPLRNRRIDTLVDVFFLHPTTFTAGKLAGVMWNASVNDAEINAKTDYTTILYQASVFNQHARVFAPRYRQAHIHAFFTTDTAAALEAFDTAYADIRKAFRHYLTVYNQGRPFIIAAHSQGTLHAARLLREYVEPDSALLSRLVCAYLIGLPVRPDAFERLQPCADSAATGCYLSWRTFRKNYLPSYVQNERVQAVVTNPLTWQTDTLAAPAVLHKGAVLFNFNKVLPQPHGAVARKGVLWIEKPRFPWSWLSSRKNYHPGDINLFYINIRDNLDLRLQSYFQAR